MTEAQTRIHPETGETLVRGMRPITITYKGMCVTFDMPGWYAETDAEGEHGLHDAKDAKASDRALNALKARANGLLEPTAIRSVRQKLRLSQKQAGVLIGGGPNAFQKYEAGDVLISKSADTALRLLANDPSRLRELTVR